jgi:hypothetical protein
MRRFLLPAHERFKARLVQLEKERAQLTAPAAVLVIRFIKPDGSPVDAMFATDRDDFLCRRNKDESLDEFEKRAVAERRALPTTGAGVPLLFYEEFPHAFHGPAA